MYVFVYVVVCLYVYVGVCVSVYVCVLILSLELWIVTRLTLMPAITASVEERTLTLLAFKPFSLMLLKPILLPFCYAQQKHLPPFMVNKRNKNKHTHTLEVCPWTWLSHSCLYLVFFLKKAFISFYESVHRCAEIKIVFSYLYCVPFKWQCILILNSCLFLFFSTPV